MPNEGFNREELLNGLKKFNESESGVINSVMSEKVLDQNRKMILVEGLGKSGPAMDYFRKVTNNRSVFVPLGNATYRNFIITPSNYEIFLQRKNIAEYLEFFRMEYLKN